MGWVLTANDLLIEIVSSVMIGKEVVHGGAVPGILIGRGAGPSPTQAQDQASFVPNHPELQEIERNAIQIGSRLTKHPNFASHYKSHKGLLEIALGKNYSNDPVGENAFLKDLGDQISTRKLKPIGIVTLGKNQRMAYAYRGHVGTSDLTAIVFPSGQWNTLLTSDRGKASGFFYQMRFDARFPFPFMTLNSSGGFSRMFL